MVGQVADGREIGDVAVHGKDAVGHDQFAAGVPRALELPAQILHVFVPVAEAGGFAKSHTVYDRGMIERVRKDGVLFVEYGLEQPRIGIEAG